MHRLPPKIHNAKNNLEAEQEAVILKVLAYKRGNVL
jgi:hypothetical protein